MVALYVILVIVALIICLLFTNIKVAFSYKDKLSLKVKYFITVFDTTNLENNKKHPEKASKKQKKVKFSIKQLEEYFKSYNSVIAFFKLLSGLLTEFGKFLKRVRLYNTELKITVADRDAAATAIKYGACCSVVYPAVTLLSNTVNFSPKTIDITSDFTGENFSFSIYTDISVKPIYVIIFLVSLAFSYIKLRLERDKK